MPPTSAPDTATSASVATTSGVVDVEHVVRGDRREREVVVLVLHRGGERALGGRRDRDLGRLRRSGFETLPISSSALAALLRTPIDGSLATRRASSGAASARQALHALQGPARLDADALVAVAEQADRLGDPARRLVLRRDLSRQADRRVPRLGLGRARVLQREVDRSGRQLPDARQGVEDVAAGFGAALHRAVHQRQQRRRVLRSGAPGAPLPPLPRSSCRRSWTPCASDSPPPRRSSRDTSGSAAPASRAGRSRSVRAPRRTRWHRRGSLRARDATPARAPCRGRP